MFKVLTTAVARMKAKIYDIDTTLADTTGSTLPAAEVAVLELTEQRSTLREEITELLDLLTATGRVPNGVASTRVQARVLHFRMHDMTYTGTVPFALATHSYYRYSSSSSALQNGCEIILLGARSYAVM